MAAPLTALAATRDRGLKGPPIRSLTYATKEGEANPDGKLVGEKHKHRWTEQYRDKEAYVPADSTEPVETPVKVWHQFCAEAKLKHIGTLKAPPAAQEDLWL
jgi:hypothetical protein